jgi:hypothetical protein
VGVESRNSQAINAKMEQNSAASGRIPFILGSCDEIEFDKTHRLSVYADCYLACRSIGELRNKLSGGRGARP